MDQPGLLKNQQKICKENSRENGQGRAGSNDPAFAVYPDASAFYSLEYKCALEPKPAETVSMEKIIAIDWAELITPTHSLAEMVFRGSVTYLALFLIMRFLMVRQSSTIGIADILVIGELSGSVR